MKYLLIIALLLVGCKNSDDKSTVEQWKKAVQEAEKRVQEAEKRVQENPQSEELKKQLAEAQKALQEKESKLAEIQKQELVSELKDTYTISIDTLIMMTFNHNIESYILISDHRGVEYKLTYEEADSLGSLAYCFKIRKRSFSGISIKVQRGEETTVICDNCPKTNYHLDAVRTNNPTEHQTGSWFSLEGTQEEVLYTPVSHTGGHRYMYIFAKRGAYPYTVSYGAHGDIGKKDICSRNAIRIPILVN